MKQLQQLSDSWGNQMIFLKFFRLETNTSMDLLPDILKSSTFQLRIFLHNWTTSALRIGAMATPPHSTTATPPRHAPTAVQWASTSRYSTRMQTLEETGILCQEFTLWVFRRKLKKKKLIKDIYVFQSSSCLSDREEDNLYDFAAKYQGNEKNKQKNLPSR